MTHNNPLIEKYNQLHKPQKPEPPKDPYSHLRYEDRKLIYELERLIKELKTGKAFFQEYGVKDNYRRANTIPMFKWDIEPSSNIDYNPYVKYDEGQMITIQVFRSYV
jgi:hypothetical protein